MRHRLVRQETRVLELVSKTTELCVHTRKPGAERLAIALASLECPLFVQRPPPVLAHERARAVPRLSDEEQPTA